MKESNLFNDDRVSDILNKKRIDEVIYELNTNLSVLDRNLDIVIYGGSALCVMEIIRESTFDIDCRTDNNSLLSQCIELMKIKSDLINTEIDVFITKREDLQVYKQLSNLTVKLPTLKYLLAMKIKAMRDKDIKDIMGLSKILGITSIEELETIFTTYYSKIQFSSTRKELVRELLDL